MGDTNNDVPSTTQTGGYNSDQDHESYLSDEEEEEEKPTEKPTAVEQLQRNSVSPHDEDYSEDYSEEKYELENRVISFLRILAWIIMLASVAAIIAGAAGVSIPNIIPAVGILNPAQALAVFGAVTFAVIGFAYYFLESNAAKELVIRWRALSAGERIATAIIITICLAAFLIAQIPLISEVVLPQDKLLWLAPVLTYSSVFLIVLTIGIHVGRMLYKGSEVDKLKVDFTSATDYTTEPPTDTETQVNNLRNAIKATVIVSNANHTSSAIPPPLAPQEQLPGTVNTEIENNSDKKVHHASFRPQSSS